jgi:hypothetical protein
VAVTAVSPASGRRADVMIDADPGTAMAGVAAELGRLLDGQAASSAAAYGGPGIPGYVRAGSQRWRRASRRQP